MPILKVYDDTKVFWNEVAPHLKKEEAKNSLGLGLSYGFQTNPQDCLYQSALFEGDKFLGTLICSRYYNNHNLLPSPITKSEHAQILFDKFKETKISVSNLIGELETANRYKKIICDYGGITKVHSKQGIYHCKKVILPPNQNDLIFRPAKEADISQIGQWIQDFKCEATPHDPPINGREIAKNRIMKGMIFVLEKQGHIASMAAYSRDIQTSASVNLVFTPKSLRKKGYASIVTAHVSQYLLDQGKYETNLYTDMSNPTSNKIYQNIGYEFVCDSIHLGVQM